MERGSLCDEWIDPYRKIFEFMPADSLYSNKDPGGKKEAGVSILPFKQTRYFQRPPGKMAFGFQAIPKALTTSMISTCSTLLSHVNLSVLDLPFF